jgi:hypothetical protein
MHELSNRVNEWGKAYKIKWLNSGVFLDIWKRNNEREEE